MPSVANGWCRWHATINLSPEVIGAVGRHINEHNFELVFDELAEKCAGDTAGLPSKPDPEVCKAVESCRSTFRRELLR